MRAAAIALVVLASLVANPARSQPRRVVQVTAERFTFTPSEIVVEAGGTTINLVIPKRGYKTASTTLRLTEPGRYTFECSRMCGAGHNFMRGVLVVRAPAGH
jgi:plastocyanin